MGLNGLGRVDRFSHYIDRAYEVVDDLDAFDSFLDETKSFLFGDVEGASYADGVDRLDPDDPVVESHAQRIQRMVGALVEQGRHPGGPERFHALLEVESGTEIVTGNAAAARLLDCRFPKKLSELPLDKDTRMAIRDHLSALRSERDRVGSALVEVETLKTCTVVIQRSLQTDRGVRVLLSYIDWSDALITRVSEALQLSPSEANVLGGALRGQSQREIAEARGRSLETVKAQSKSILRKLGCARMADVTSLAAGLAYLMRESDAQTGRERANLLESWITPRQGIRVLDRGKRDVAWVELGRGQRKVLFSHGLVQGPFLQPFVLAELTRRNLCLLAPSRPGYGYTSPSRSRQDYNAQCLEDALAVLGRVGLEEGVVVGHQGGTNHAIRIANHLGARCRGLLLIDGGVPVHDEAALAYMSADSRMMAALNRRSPSLLKMTTRVALPVFKHRGIGAYLRRLYGQSESDLQALHDPRIEIALALGMFHTAQQGEEIWIREGNSTMEDWEADLEACTARQIWILGDDARILRPEFTRARLDRIPHAEQIAVAEAGNTLLHTHPTVWLDALERLLGNR